MRNPCHLCSIKKLEKKLSSKLNIETAIIKFESSFIYSQKSKIIYKIRQSIPNRKIVNFLCVVLGRGYEEQLIRFSAASALYQFSIIIKKRFPDFVAQIKKKMLKAVRKFDRKYIKSILMFVKPFCTKDDIPRIKKAIINSKSSDEIDKLIKIFNN